MTDWKLREEIHELLESLRRLDAVKKWRDETNDDPPIVSTQSADSPPPVQSPPWR